MCVKTIDKESENVISYFSAHCVLKNAEVLMDSVKSSLIRDEMSEKIIETAEKLACSIGAHTITVRKILRELGITNRVFYNRFHNLDEVLRIVYKNTIMKIRSGVASEIDEKSDFFEHTLNLASSAVFVSYETKMQFSQYVFETDSASDSNHEWWTDVIKKHIEYGKEKGYIKDVDAEVLSYSIWCFCRGYNADVVARNLPRDKAIADFKYSFGFLLDGLKK